MAASEGIKPEKLKRYTVVTGNWFIFTIKEAFVVWSFNLWITEQVGVTQPQPLDLVGLQLGLRNILL